MKVVDVFLIILAVTFGYTQAPDTLWTKTYGGDSADFAYSIQQTEDGGYIVVGPSSSFGAGDDDLWLLRTDSTGGIIWSKNYGGANSDWGNAVRQTTDGGYVIAANTESYGAGGSDVWLMKTDSVGDTTWAITYGGTEDDWCVSVQQTTDGGYFLTGQTKSFCVGSPGDIWLLKTDSDGDTLWTKTYGGDTNYEAMSAFGCETSDGGYVVAANYWLPQGGVLSGWHIRTDAYGETLWTKVYNEKQFCSVRQTPDSGYILVGGCRDSLMQPCLYLVRTDAQGESLWTKSYFCGIGFSLQLTSDGCYIITGIYQYLGEFRLWILKMTANGDSLWTRTYGESTSGGYAVQQTADYGYIVCGFKYDASTSFDFWLLKMESDVGARENGRTFTINRGVTATIFRGPLRLPEGETCKVFDISGRLIEPTKIQPGIYFIEVDGVVTQKVVKVR